MKTWMKVVIGCLAVGTIAVFLLVAGLVGLGYWAKNRVEEIAGGGPVVEEARRIANAEPFQRPEGGIVAEARLVRFIEVRAGVFSVYEKYRAEIDSRVARVKEGGSLNFTDISTGLTFMGELQKAEALALAKHGMSEEEYAFITEEVYKSMWTDLDETGTGEKVMEEVATVAAKATADALKSAQAEDIPPEARDALARAGREIAAGSRQARAEMKRMGTAPENVALFKKYESELKKYAMPGLRLLFGEEGASNPESTATDAK